MGTPDTACMQCCGEVKPGARLTFHGGADHKPWVLRDNLAAGTKSGWVTPVVPDQAPKELILTSRIEVSLQPP